MSPATDAPDRPPEVTVVFPCLNEEAAIGQSVDAALRALDEAGLAGEVLVVDNASTDRSAEIAREHGARVVAEPRRGYGSAYLRGFREALGTYVVMLDADGTYPAERIGEFVRILRDEDADVVLGNRFAGQMERDAMPFLNRYVGNPILSGMTRLLFRVPLRDMHCGLRAVRRDRLEALQLQTPGMEFATEMIVKALDHQLVVRQVDIPYRPRVGESKLHPLRDGWRHVEYMLVFSPALLFLWPGLLLFGAGLLVQLALVTGPVTFLRTWDVHASIAGLAASLVGTMLLLLGTVSASWSATIGMRFRHSALTRGVGRMGDGPVRALGGLLALAGGGIWVAVTWGWAASGFGQLAAVPLLALATSLLASGLGFLATAFLVHAINLGR